jgi:hypothetical protein
LPRTRREAQVKGPRTASISCAVPEAIQPEIDFAQGSQVLTSEFIRHRGTARRSGAEALHNPLRTAFQKLVLLLTILTQNQNTISNAFIAILNFDVDFQPLS